MSEAAPSPPAALAAGRLMSLDVFRGATIAGMMLVNNPGSWSHVYPPLEHAEWNGWTFTDTIFPFFLWIVGVAIPLATARRLEQGQNRGQLFRHALRRALIIFGLGLFLATLSALLDGSLGQMSFAEWLRNYLTTVRLPGVLQRIAVCYLIATVIFLRTNLRGQVIWTVGFLLAYWLLMTLAPFPVNVQGETLYLSGGLEKGINFSAYVDNLVLNGPIIGTHVWKVARTWDPEGIVSTLPAIASCLFGVLTGHLLRTRRSATDKTAWLMVAGALLMWTGQWMNLWLPINKTLWTSSYAVFMAGLAMICFGVCYWFVDVKGCRTLVKPLAIYGMNALTVFVLSGVLGRLLSIKIHVATAPEKLVTVQSQLYEGLFGSLVGGNFASLLWGVIWVAMLYLVAAVLYRLKWFVKF
jgi:predicted acyltransferase